MKILGNGKKKGKKGGLSHITVGRSKAEGQVGRQNRICRNIK